LFILSLKYDSLSFDRKTSFTEDHLGKLSDPSGEPIVKKILISALVFLSVAFFSLARPALAADGAAVFTANCASCHMGGKNVVNPAKTLKKEDLAKYGKDSVEAIATQVTKGAGAMPAFGGRLSAEEIEAVANYVLAQSEKGW
jgi:cytochrome c6